MFIALFTLSQFSTEAWPKAFIAIGLIDRMGMIDFCAVVYTLASQSLLAATAVLWCDWQLAIGELKGFIVAFIRHCLHGAIVAHYELTDKLTVGRAETNDISLEDTTVSSSHAQISVTDTGSFLFEDLGSTNGLLYKGKRTESGILEVGECLLIGLHEFSRVDQLSSDMERTLRIKKSWIPGVYYTSDK